MLKINRIVIFAMTLLAACPLYAASGAGRLHLLTEYITGTVQSGDTLGSLPIAYANVTLYQAGSARQGKDSKARILGKTRSKADGTFRIPYSAPSDEQAVLYLIAEGQTLIKNRKIRVKNKAQDNTKAQIRNKIWVRKKVRVRSPIKFVAVLGTEPFPSQQVINELTTAAGAYALAQFIDGENIAGSYPGLQNAASMVHNLANNMGQVADFLVNSPNGGETTTRDQFNSLANMLAACVNTPASCSELFRQTKPPRGPAAKNTLRAVSNIVHNPWQNVSALFAIAQLSSLYEPALSPFQIPAAWTLAIRYTDGNNQLDGPGNIAFDSDGNAWINNNYTNSTDNEKVCGSDLVFAFKTNGEPLPGSPYGGNGNNGGLYGSGFGISVLPADTGFVDPKETVWVSNFGFQGSQCAIVEPIQKKLSESISQFDLDGMSLSPNRVDNDPATGGWRQGSMLQPQGTAVDHYGSMWIANCGNASVTKYSHGNPDMAQNFLPLDEQNNAVLDKPFGIAADGNGVAWVASNGNDRVVGIGQDGDIIAVIANKNNQDAVIKLPMGITVDSFGNKWVSNSDGITTPCAGDTKKELISEQIANAETPPDNASIALIRANGKVETFTGGGIFLPWGIAVDGDDIVYAANFGSPKNETGWDPVGLVVLCGAKPGYCPPGYKTGDAISPPTGYTSNALTRITGVQIDPSGNVVMVNNWKLDAFREQENPGGYQIVVFIGLAAPVKTPMVGLPQKPK